MEVEFDSVDAANEFTAPDWFGEDVTESGKYHNKLSEPIGKFIVLPGLYRIL